MGNTIRGIRPIPALDERAEARFWSKVPDRGADGCWNWAGTMARVKGGPYGLFATSRCVNALAHRVAYTLVKGAIPDALTIDHLCRNTLCVNPAHLEAVTHRENVLRGYAPSARCAQKTHCKRGHPLSGANLAVYAGARQCRQCIRDRHNAAYRAKVA